MVYSNNQLPITNYQSPFGLMVRRRGARQLLNVCKIGWNWRGDSGIMRAGCVLGLNPDFPVVAKIEWHAGELFPRVGFIVTNLRWKSSNVVKFYNKRGTAEQWIKEGKYALNWTKLSCHEILERIGHLKPVPIGSG